MHHLLGVAVGAAYQVVSVFAQALSPLAGSLATPAAIVIFTIAVRSLLLPLSYYAIRGQASQARLVPQVQALRQRHAGQPEKLQRELAALYQRERTGVLAGFLPLLLQLPFLSVIYQLLRSAAIDGRPNRLLGHDLFGAPLGSHWLSGPGPLSVQGAVFLGLFTLLAVAAWLATRVTRRLAARQSPAAAAPGRTARPGQAGRRGQAGQPGPPGGALGWLARAIPYTTLAVAAVMPLAVGLYLLTATAWAAGERAILGGRAGTARPARPGPAREAPGRSRPSGTGRGEDDVRAQSRSA